MGTLGQIAIGARGQVAYKEEAAWGVALAPDQRVNFVSESLNNEVGNLTSEAIDPSRGIDKQVRGTSNIGGDIAFEQNTEGYEVWYYHAFGDAVTINAADGGIRARVVTQAGGGGVLVTDTAMDVDATLGGTTGFETAPGTPGTSEEWDLVAVYKDANGLLKSAIFTYTGVTDADTFNITGSETAGGGDNIRTETIPVGAWIFQHEAQGTSGNGYWDGVYTHYIEAAPDLPEGQTIEVGRDVAFFVYSGMKVNTIENSYAAQEILQATVNYLGKGEYSGGDLNADVSVSDTSIVVKNLTEDPSDSTAVIGFDKTGGTIQIGDENGIVYTAYTYAPATGLATFTGIAASGATSIEYAHSEDEPVGAQVAWDTPSDPPSTDMLSSFQAGIYLDGSWEEVLSGNWTLNNNLFADKYQMGERFRAGLPEQQRTVEGLIHVEFDNLILYHKFINGTEAFLEIRAVDETESIATAAGDTAGYSVYRQKHTLFPRIKFTGTTPQIGGPEMIEHDMNYTALRDPDNDMNEVAVIYVNTINRAF
jgi:hypothetical protein